MRRSHLLAAIPAGLGVLAAVVVRIQNPTTDFFMETRLWIACLVGGLIVTAVLTIPLVVRQRAAEARAVGIDEGRRQSAQDHHRFLLRLDHELKNPVTAMQAAVANLSQTTNQPAALESVSAQVRRMAELVADLRKLAELETRPIESAPVDLGELLGEVHETVADLPGASERTVAVSLPQAPWPLGTIPGDRDLLFLALYNLLANAVKFTRPGDRIEVRARDEGSQVLVEVADTGLGIPDDEVGQIWEELARGSEARGLPGMGIGLALVRAVVTRHGGSVSVRSRAGSGTVIEVGLPSG